MTSKQCPQCDSSNEIVAAVCKNCGYSYFASKSVIEPAPAVEEAQPNGPTAHTRTRIPIPVHVVSRSDQKAGLKPLWEALNVAVWVGACLGFAFLGLTLTGSIASAQSAPQEAAAAAINIGYMIVLYGIARGLSEVLKTLIRS